MRFIVISNINSIVGVFLLLIFFPFKSPAVIV